MIGLSDQPVLVPCWAKDIYGISKQVQLLPAAFLPYCRCQERLMITAKEKTAFLCWKAGNSARYCAFRRDLKKRKADFERLLVLKPPSGRRSLRCVNCGSDARVKYVYRWNWTITPKCDCHPAAYCQFETRRELYNAIAK